MPTLYNAVPPPPDVDKMTPQQIAEYYAGKHQERENQIITDARQAVDAIRTQQGTVPQVNPTTPAQPTSSVTISKEDFWNDPQKAVNTILQQQGVTDLTKIGGAAQNTLIESAKQLAKGQVDQKHWSKYASEIDQLMSTMPLESRVDPNMWRTAYGAVIGAHVAEIEADAKKSILSPAEVPSGAPTPPPTPRALGQVELQVINGLGISEDTFRTAEKNMQNGVWPLTMDNTKKKVTA